MKRKYEKDLLNWKSDKDRKPLLLRGARQVGKSWLMEEFGKKHYKDFIHINFDQNEDIKETLAYFLQVHSILSYQ